MGNGGGTPKLLDKATGRKELPKQKGKQGRDRLRRCRVYRQLSLGCTGFDYAISHPKRCCIEGGHESLSLGSWS